MKPTCTMYHPDGVSGATRYDDGSVAYWTEGRDSVVVLVRGDEIRYIDVDQWQLMCEANPNLEDVTDEARDMTPEEEYEMDRAMGWLVR